MNIKTECVCALNDVLRTTVGGDQVVVTSGIAAPPLAEGEAIVRAVQTFTLFMYANLGE